MRRRRSSSLDMPMHRPWGLIARTAGVALVGLFLAAACTPMHDHPDLQASAARDPVDTGIRERHQSSDAPLVLVLGATIPQPTPLYMGSLVPATVGVTLGHRDAIAFMAPDGAVLSILGPFAGNFVGLISGRSRAGAPETMHALYQDLSRFGPIISECHGERWGPFLNQAQPQFAALGMDDPPAQCLRHPRDGTQKIAARDAADRPALERAMAHLRADCPIAGRQALEQAISDEARARLVAWIIGTGRIIRCPR